MLFHKTAVMLGAALTFLITMPVDAQGKRPTERPDEKAAPIFKIQMSEPSILQQGRRDLKRGRPKAALAKFNRFIRDRSDPEYLPGAYNGACAAQIELRQFKDALESCDNAIKLNSRKWRSHNNRGTALFHLGRLRDAIKAFESGQKLAPKNKILASNLQLTQARLASLTGGSR